MKDIALTSSINVYADINPYWNQVNVHVVYITTTGVSSTVLNVFVCAPKVLSLDNRDRLTGPVDY